jgi:LacI family transcriptional regulator
MSRGGVQQAMADEHPETPEQASTRARPTIADVAREAGVGVGTASRALTGHPRVAETTRRHVLATAERLGYRASSVARAFSKRRTHIIELVIPLIGRYLFMEILRGVQEALADTDYSLVIRSVERASERERVFEACCVAGRSDGVLFVSMHPPDRLVERLAASRFPAVLIGTASHTIPSVTIDYTTGEAKAVRHCVDLGHSRIALIDRPDDPFAPTQSSPRLLGYRQGMTEAGLPVRDDYVHVVPFDPAASADALATLMSLDDPPTAILVGSDTQAMGVLDQARRQQLRVPQDVSVVGYNDVELAPYLGLTTLHVPMREMGRKGTQLLLNALEGGGTDPGSVLLSTELVIRRTCGPPPSV